ncbi:hypothetical protein JW905_10630 [bacterium]|nr:hypothetical protein [candidate division CSSED10-310 bacterium]
MDRKTGVVHFVLVFAVMVSGLTAGQASAADTVPPYLSAPVPPPGTQDVSTSAVITVSVADDDSGVVEESIEMEVDGIRVEPIIEPADFDTYIVAYYPEAGDEYPAGAEIPVTVFAQDFSSNQLIKSWTFTVTADEGRHDVEPVFPLEGFWISHERDGRMARFSWSKSRMSDWYRLMLCIYSDSATSMCAEVDLPPGSTADAWNIITAPFTVQACDWGLLSGLDHVTWQVASLDAGTMLPLCDYSRPCTVRFAALDAPILTKPQQGSWLSGDTPPIFKWQRHPDAMSYLFGMIQVDERGAFTGDPITGDLPFFVNELAVSPTVWDTVADGNWLWTVVAVFPDSSFSPYMLSFFTKD